MSHPAFSDDDKAFLRAILSNPAELTAWLVYADWLDERADPRAAFIRLEVKRLAHDTTQTERFGIVARLEELRRALDPDWVAIFDRPRVENCDDLFAFKCPKQWEKLKGTDEPTVRHCAACHKSVYYCHTIREAYDRARKGDCVAVAEGVRRTRGDLERDPDEPLMVRTMGLMLTPLGGPPNRRPPSGVRGGSSGEGMNCAVLTPKGADTVARGTAPGETAGIGHPERVRHAEQFCPGPSARKFNQSLPGAVPRATLSQPFGPKDTITYSTTTSR